VWSKFSDESCRQRTGKILDSAELRLLFSEVCVATRSRFVWHLLIYWCRVSGSAGTQTTDIKGEALTFRKSTTKGKLKTRVVIYARLAVLDVFHISWKFLENLQNKGLCLRGTSLQLRHLPLVDKRLIVIPWIMEMKAWLENSGLKNSRVTITILIPQSGTILSFAKMILSSLPKQQVWNNWMQQCFYSMDSKKLKWLRCHHG